MAYTFEQSYYFRPYRGNSSFWLNRYGNGNIASHQKATLYTAAGSADQRLKVHKVSGGCQLLSDLNNAYADQRHPARFARRHNRTREITAKTRGLATGI